MCGMPVSNQRIRCEMCWKKVHRNNKTKRNCANCGNELEILPYVAKAKVHSFCNKECCNEWQRREPNEGPRKGRTVYGKGYAWVYDPDRPKNRRRIHEHTLIGEQTLGRRLKQGELVHHINMNKTDNRHCNLLICDQWYHRWLHHQMELAWAREHLIE